MLTKRILPGTPATAFDTSDQKSPILAHFTTAKRLARQLRRSESKCIIPAEAFSVEEREGSLNEGKIERAQDWAGSILKRIHR